MHVAACVALPDSFTPHTHLGNICGGHRPLRSTFQYFGLDFLVDTDMHPWLMEVNATPSMKVRRAQGSVHAPTLILLLHAPLTYQPFVCNTHPCASPGGVASLLVRPCPAPATAA
jgi:hypothetical protein